MTDKSGYRKKQHRNAHTKQQPEWDLKPRPHDREGPSSTYHFQGKGRKLTARLEGLYCSYCAPRLRSIMYTSSHT